jgi:hypothetical protein
MISTTTETSLAGTWELLSREDMTCDGQRQTEATLGSNPLAYLIYDAAGHFAVQFMKRDRGSPVSPSERPAGDANSSGAIHGYDAYFGRYTAGADGTVTEELVGAMSPGDVGKVVTRHFRVIGTELTITLEALGNNREAVTRTIRWRRVA